MDPLSIAASVAGLLTITAAIVSQGYAHLSQAKKNEGDIARLLNEVASFSGILYGLKSHYASSDEPNTSLSKWFEEDSKETWEDTLQACEVTLTEIKDLVTSLASAKPIKLIVKGASMTSRTEKLLAQIERYKSLFVLCLQLQNKYVPSIHFDHRVTSSSADSRTTTRLTLEILDLIHELADKQDLLIKKAEAKEQAELRGKLIDWLGPTTEHVQDDVVKRRDPQACQWLLDRPEFLRWLELNEFTGFWLWGTRKCYNRSASSSILTTRDTEGSGKTVITSRVIDVLESDLLEEEDVMVYHYCRFSDSAELSSEKVIGSLVAQLLHKLSDRAPLPEVLTKRFGRRRSPPYPSTKDVLQAFHELCKHASRVFVVLDGLDELHDRAEILEFLTELEIVGGVFKVFVASRPEVDLEFNFETYITVPVTQSDVQLDMETYVRQRLEKLHVDDDDVMNQESITTELVGRAQGMFLWSVCQLDYLSRIRTAITTDVLTTLPQGLESTFEDILLRLEDEDQTLALEILRLITFSGRALDLAEIVEAVAVTHKTKNLRELRTNALRRPNDIFDVCGSLIQRSQSSGKISLSHYSVKEFLSQPTLSRGRQNPFFLQDQSSQVSLCQKCIFYLGLEDFASETFRETLRLALDPLYADSDFQSTTSFPFLDYASNYWAHHLKTLDTESLHALWPVLEGFFNTTNGSFDTWILISQYNHGEYKFPHGAKAVHVAALYGLNTMLAGLLNADVSSCTLQTSDGRTVLHIALENENERSIDLIVQSRGRYDPLIHKLLNIKDNRDRTPLITAIESGSEIAVVKLVTAGANVNSLQTDGRTPISVAVENQWDMLADYLAAMADYTQRLSDGRSLLHIAAESGSLAWTTALLKSSKDQLIDSEDGNGWTPLHYAVDRQHVNIVRALVESKCTLEARDKNGWTPLHAAVRRQNLECASLILKGDWLSGSLRRARRRTVAVGGPSPSSQSAVEPQATSQTNPWPPPSTRDPSLPSLTGKYAGERNRDNTQQASSRFIFPPTRARDSQASSSHLWPSSSHQRPSPLHLAVTEGYTEGVKLLVQHTNKLVHLGCDRTEQLQCYRLALGAKNVDIILLTMKLRHGWQVEEDLLPLVQLSSDPINEYLKTIITANKVYRTHILDANRLGVKELIPSLMRIWPDVDDSTLCGAVHGNTAVAKVFIEHGISPSRLIGGPEPLLHTMIERGDLVTALSLVEHFPNLDVRNNLQDTALLVLSGLKASSLHDQQDALKLAQKLVANGADIHILDARSAGLCHRATAAGNQKFLAWALETLNLDPDSRDWNSRTPLLRAVECGSIESVNLLLKHLSMDKREGDGTGCERMIDAMEYGNMRSAPLLRAMVDRIEKNPVVPLALIKADENAFKQLSPARQADLESLRTAFYLETLTWTIDCDFYEVFIFLLPKVPKSALLSRNNLDGDTIFHVAVNSKKIEYLKVVLQTLGDMIDQNSKILSSLNSRKESPLDRAIEAGQPEKTALLLLHGAKPTNAQVIKAKIKGIELSEGLITHEMAID